MAVSSNHFTVCSREPTWKVEVEAVMAGFYLIAMTELSVLAAIFVYLLTDDDVQDMWLFPHRLEPGTRHGGEDHIICRHISTSTSGFRLSPPCYLIFTGFILLTF